MGKKLLLLIVTAIGATAIQKKLKDQQAEQRPLARGDGPAAQLNRPTRTALGPWTSPSGGHGAIGSAPALQAGG